MRWRAGVIAVSETVKQDIVRRLGVAPDFVRVLFNGIDLEAFSREIGNVEEERRKEGLRGDAVVAVHVARLVEQKNHMGMLEALSRVASRRPELQLLVVGAGPMRGRLEEEARRLGLEGRVVFAGRRDDVPRLLGLSDFSVLPSFKEGFSNVIVESLASGLPLLVTDVGGNAEAVRDGVEGFVVKDPKDVGALSAALDRLAGDAGLRRTMSASARERARCFSLDEMARQTAELYGNLYNRAKGGGSRGA